MLFCPLSITEEKQKYDVIDIFELYHKDLLKITAQKLKAAGDPNYIVDAQDVVQEVYVKLAKYIKTVNGVSKSELKAYLYAIAANETKGYLCRMRQYEPTSEMTKIRSDDEFIDRLLIRERYERVVDCIGALDEKYSIVMLFRYVQGYSPRRIAKILGVNTAVVYSRLKTGKQKLIELLDGGIDNEK